MAEIMNGVVFGRLFNEAADLNVDDRDLEYANAFIGRRLYMLLLAAQERARDRGHTEIRLPDVPITEGLRSKVDRYESLEVELEPVTVLERRADMPALEMDIADETQAALPRLAGGLAVALAHTFTTINPKLKNPNENVWTRASDVFSIVL